MSVGESYWRESIQLQIDYARELNEQQHAAVTAPPGPALVIAGAGSGKTRALTYRVAYLLEQGIPPDRILLLTFTNKAAREMMRRVAELLQQEVPNLWGGTFHAIGNRILRQYADRLGFQRDFSILDREDARHVLASCIEESADAKETVDFPKAEVLAEIFSFAVNTRKSIPAVLSELYGSEFERFTVQFTGLQERYAVKKRAINALDFDDLLGLWHNLLAEDEDARAHYQRRFQFILVDEYQDTNKLQSELIDLLAARHNNVMVVGDDAQSIYAWRGAHFLNILDFPKRYPGAKVYRIETNYRSTPEILRVANAAISANVHQHKKELAASRKSGSKPQLVACYNSAEQAALVAQRAVRLREEGVRLDRMAVLYRSHFHALDLQLVLVRNRIPYTITSGTRFFEQAHLKDVTAYLKLVLNPRDEISFKRLVRLLPGIGAKGAEKLWKTFERQLPAAIAQPARLDEEHAGTKPGVPEKPEAVRHPIATALQACAAGVPKKSQLAWAQFVATMAQLEGEEMRNHAGKMIQLVVEAGYEDLLKQSYDNYRSRIEDLEQLASYSQDFPTVQDFLSQLALVNSLEAEAETAPDADEERLRLSTIHQAKGLEFDVVFLIMLCDGLFPSERSLNSLDGEEEERRLMYVAITRARNELYLTYPLLRSMPGGDHTPTRPSRFLEEIPKELLEEWSPRTYNPYG